MDLNNCWKIGLSNKKNILSQYVVAETFDDAIKAAQNTFHARLHNLDCGNVAKSGQKACNKIVLCHPLRFGFCGGHVTLRPSGHETAFSMLKTAQELEFVNNEDITEIYWHDSK